MKTSLRILIFLSIQTLFGRLTVKNIEDAFSEIIKKSKYAEKIQTLENSIVNPIFGYIFESVGGLDNIRFYGPGLKLPSKNKIRNYSNDTSNDFITNLIINLFPLQTDTLCHIGPTKDNFDYEFKKDKENGILFLADVFIKTLVPDHTIASISSYFNSRKHLFECQKDGHEKSENLNDPSIMRMIIHLFIINALDSSEDLKLYLNHICAKIKVDNIDNYGINFDISKRVYEIEKKKKEFPYNKFNYPVQTDILKIPNGKTVTYNKNLVVANSPNVILLHICNCLFYDSENQCYSIGSLAQSSKLAQFYKKNNQLFKITNKIKKEWSKVISKLEAFDYVSGDRLGAINLILYEKKNQKYEVQSGIINMMNILIDICYIEHIPFWGNFYETQDIETKLKTLFAKLSNLSGNHVTVDLKNMKFKEFQSHGRIDYMGKFYLKFKNEYEMLVDHQRPSEDSRMNIESYPEIKVLSNPEINKLLNASELPLKILARYFSITNGNFADNQSKEVDIENNTKFNYSFPDDTENVFNKLYFSRKIKTNEQKKDALLNIVRVINKNEIDQDNINKPLDKEKRKTLESIMCTIYSTAPLKDNENRKSFVPYLLYTKYIKDDDTLLNCWYDSLKIKTTDLYKLYELEILKSQIQEIHLREIDKFNGRIEYIFDVLSKKENLKKMTLTLPYNMEKKELKYLLEGLTKLKNINEIDLSNNFTLDLDTLKQIFTALKELENLTRLNISNNKIGNADR